ncbi:MAG TPA: 2-phospho-L-lactate guanylyltransferase, partial [Candidatus Bathyarchaeia archaeon]|nr:2-phospho-L-lactate guanylyltransferase [Candidatus Bathyarchaeia archaeon]
MKDIAVVPVKGLTDAKKRLADYLSPIERKKLVRAMLLDVLNALHESRSFAEVLVVSPD